MEDASLSVGTDNTSESLDGSECSTADLDSQNSWPKETKGGALCTPAVRTLSKQYGVDVNDVCGTGKDGRVLREDVLSYVAKKGIIEEKFTPSYDSEEDPQGQRSQWEDKKVPLR